MHACMSVLHTRATELGLFTSAALCRAALHAAQHRNHSYARKIAAGDRAGVLVVQILQDRHPGLLQGTGYR